MMLTRRQLLACACCGASAIAIGNAGAAAQRLSVPAPQGLRITDVHAHLYVRDYLARASELGLWRPGYGSPAGTTPSASPPIPKYGDDGDASLASRVALMDAAGVREQVLSPTVAPYSTGLDGAVRAARMLNDRYASVVRVSAGRLSAFVSLPLPHVPEALDELRRGLDQLGMVGVAMHASCLGESIAADRFEPIFAEINARRAVLFVHPAVNGLSSPLINEWGLAAAAGPLLEDATIALHFIVRGVPIRYPNIRVIIPHLGGGLATMLERLDNQLPLSVPHLVGKPSEMARTFWYDTVSHGSAAALQAAVRAFGAERIVTGSDFPVLQSFEAYSQTIGYVRRAGLPRRAVDRILYHNAEALLGSTR